MALTAAHFRRLFDRCDQIDRWFHSAASSAASQLVCSQRVVAVIRIENGAETGKCDGMPWFSKRVLFPRHLNGLLNHRLKHRLCRSSADDDDDSIEEAKDAALASIIKHCEGKRCLFRSATCLHVRLSSSGLIPRCVHSKSDCSS